MQLEVWRNVGLLRRYPLGVPLGTALGQAFGWRGIIAQGLGLMAVPLATAEL
ncbi:hypothetical protein [Yersinia aldovae]|uniref:hypothetical protein n=1 Tax=Yersinia aldovae TaxID=29483 RepID=UPI000AC89EC8|nr:hypothetical protein [Yersinia aldovae]